MGLFDNIERMWFGTEEKMGWIETPQTGADVSSLGQSASSILQNGGGNARNSWDSHKVYQFSWGDSAPPSLVSLLQAYRNGSYGRGFLYFHDPMNYHTNLLPKRWADPSMAANFEAEPLIPDVWPTSSPVVSNGNNYPVRSATYAVPGGYSSQNNNSEHFIPIPEGMVLVLGAAYSGDASVYVRTPNGITDIPSISTTDANVVNTVVRNRAWARIGIRRFGGAGTISITGMTARLVDDVPTGEGLPFSFTNLATNPSFEAADAAITIRTNACINPKPTAALPGTGWTSSAGAVSYGANGYTTTNSSTITPFIFSAPAAGGAVLGRVYAMSAKIRATPVAGQSNPPNIIVRARRNVGGAYFVLYGGNILLPVDGQTYTVRAHWVASTTITEAEGFTLSAAGTATGPTGFALSMDEVLIEEVPSIDSAYPSFFYGGGASPDPDMATSYAGIAGSSASLLTARPVSTYGSGLAFGIRSTTGVTSGNYALRQIPTNPTRGTGYTGIASSTLPNGLVRGQRYTVIATFYQAAAQGFSTTASRQRTIALVNDNGAAEDQYVAATNTSGGQMLRFSFVVPVAGNWYLRLYNGGQLGDPDTFWDYLTIVQGVYSGAPFNGADNGVAWDGTPNASTSTLTGRTPLSGEIALGPWMSGEGHSGCRFQGNPTVINYNGVGGGQLGLSAIFQEVGAWE